MSSRDELVSSRFHLTKRKDPANGAKFMVKKLRAKDLNGWKGKHLTSRNDEANTSEFEHN